MYVQFTSCVYGVCHRCLARFCYLNFCVQFQNLQIFFCDNILNKQKHTKAEVFLKLFRQIFLTSKKTAAMVTDFRNNNLFYIANTSKRLPLYNGKPSYLLGLKNSVFKISRLFHRSSKYEPHKMVKQTETNCQLFPTSCLSVFDHFVWLALKA